MGKRREARERAVQFLFQHDLNPPDNLELELATFWNSQRAAAIEDEKSGHAKWGEVTELPPPTAEEAELRLFAEPLIRGTLEHRDAIDEKIKVHAKNWDFHRIAAVDRNIMRLAIYEMLHRQDIPPVVSINEAVDIAKKFSTQDSGKFVNGILDAILMYRTYLNRAAADNLLNRDYELPLGGVNFDDFMASMWMAQIKPLTGRGRSGSFSLTAQF